VRILLVEDEPAAAHIIAKGLREHAYAVDVANCARAALQRASASDYDAIVLDVGLPDGDGLDVCRELRDVGMMTPILMLTARDSVHARIAGLDSGADDYVTKPFDFDELLARLRAVLRRGTRALLPEQLHVGPLELNTRARLVSARGGPALRLTTREYALLEYFARHAGEVVGRAAIAEHVWDDTYDPFSNVIDVYVQRLRRKLAAAGCGPLIKTRRGLGYMLTEEDALE
jgi:two-component system copper resistance phosphate regulon response regulator CusR